MKTICSLILAMIGISVFAQSDIEKLKNETVAEAKRMYESEMASWHGTDLFLEKFSDRSKIGGYLSYVEPEKATCIFFDKSDKPKTLGTITFDKTFDLKKASVDLTSRDLSKLEMDYFNLRNEALKAMADDTIFKRYNNTNLNIVPIVDEKENKVYVLTGATKGQVVIYGNDYLMLFDKKNKLKSAQKLHKGLLAMKYGDEGDGKQYISSVHSHLPEYSEIMTATDICTTMLYQKLTNWESAQVMSKKYISTWDCKTQTLLVETREEFEKRADEKK